MKKFRCIPIAAGLPVIFLAFLLICLGIAVSCYLDGDTGGVILFLVFSLMAAGLAAYTIVPGVRRVGLHPETIICRGLPGSFFEMRYENCVVGMDYHVQNDAKVWWIYLCEGVMPVYRKGNPANRINSLKIGPGFIRIMYSDEAFEALMEVLPKKQKTGLVTARRCAGFEKHGRLI